jgi:hypothetical protein
VFRKLNKSDFDLGQLSLSGLGLDDTFMDDIRYIVSKFKTQRNLIEISTQVIMPVFWNAGLKDAKKINLK